MESDIYAAIIVISNSFSINLISKILFLEFFQVLRKQTLEALPKKGILNTWLLFGTLTFLTPGFGTVSF